MATGPYSALLTYETGLIAAIFLTKREGCTAFYFIIGWQKHCTRSGLGMMVCAGGRMAIKTTPLDTAFVPVLFFTTVIVPMPI